MIARRPSQSGRRQPIFRPINADRPARAARLQPLTHWSRSDADLVALSRRRDPGQGPWQIEQARHCEAYGDGRGFQRPPRENAAAQV
jgi:hypothetical protein